jgi:hypothetical protein
MLLFRCVDFLIFVIAMFLVRLRRFLRRFLRISQNFKSAHVGFQVWRGGITKSRRGGR